MRRAAQGYSQRGKRMKSQISDEYLARNDLMKNQLNEAITSNKEGTFLRKR